MQRCWLQEVQVLTAMTGVLLVQHNSLRVCAQVLILLRSLMQTDVFLLVQLSLASRQHWVSVLLLWTTCVTSLVMVKQRYRYPVVRCLIAISGTILDLVRPHRFPVYVPVRILSMLPMRMDVLLIR